MLIWLHYEKVKRICTYCAGFFHNAEHCPVRNRRLLSTGRQQGFGHHGLWMTQSIRIPMHLVHNQLTEFQDLSAPPSDALRSLREAFAGITMGHSAPPMQRPTKTPGIIFPGGNLPSIRAPAQQDDTTHHDAMVLDQFENTPVQPGQMGTYLNIVSESTATASAGMQVQTNQGTAHPEGQLMQGVVVPNEFPHTQMSEPIIQSTTIQHATTQKMLHVTQLNIQQTQVQLQVTNSQLSLIQ